jgi:DNA (cytosine-5)-methyltransferase 1
MLRPLDIEVFPCSGGMAEGFRRAGVVFDFAFERDADACESYASNLGHRPVQMDVRDLLRMLRGGWRPGPVRLLVADPPCTPWSRAGKRLGVKDERDMLRVTTELVELLEPQAYLIGNVPGLDDSTQVHHMRAALDPLDEMGYCTQDFISLDAADYGVAQHRVRPFWYGHRRGTPCIRWPAPTHCSPFESRQLRIDGPPLKPWVTCRQALQHLPLEELGRPVRVRNKSSFHPCSDSEKPANTISAAITGNGGNVLLSERLEDPNRPPTCADEVHRTITTGGRGHQFAVSWPWDRPATTVHADDVLAPYGRNGRTGEHQKYHPNAVVLSERAAALLQGFPEGWVFSGKTKTTRWSQLGQAMPPPLAHAVARSVVEQLEGCSTVADELVA